MASAVRLRGDYSAAELRALPRRSKNVNQSRRLLSLAAVRDGMDRGSAAKIGGMDRQTLRDCPSLQRVGSGGPPPLRSMARLGQSKTLAFILQHRSISGLTVSWPKSTVRGFGFQAPEHGGNVTDHGLRRADSYDGHHFESPPLHQPVRETDTDCGMTKALLANSGWTVPYKHCR